MPTLLSERSREPDALPARPMMRMAAPGGFLRHYGLATALIVLPVTNDTAEAFEHRTDRASASITVLDVSRPLYRPKQGAPGTASEASACTAWSLDKDQVASVFRLSTKLVPGELHDFYWLPCSIKGTARIQGKDWEFEINAAGTSTWRSGDEAHLMGCSQEACEPLIILMPERNH